MSPQIGSMEEEAVRRVVEAWVVEGTQPTFHRHQIMMLEKNWPVMAEAVKMLVRVRSRQGELGVTNG